MSRSPIPTPSQRSLEVDFLENRSSEFRDVAGAFPHEFDESRAKFVAIPTTAVLATRVNDVSNLELEESRSQLESRTKSFLAAINASKLAKGKSKGPTESRLDLTQNWEEAMTVVKEAVEKYESRNHKWAKVRRVFRRVGDNAASIQSFVGLLPDGTYKTLCGGLNLILKGMMEHSKMHARMADVLEDVPFVVHKCEQYMELYPGRNTLLQYIHEIYLGIFMVLEDMVHWYEQSTKRHVVQSVLQNDLYGQSIDLNLTRIGQSKTRFFEETRLYSDWLSRGTYNTTQVMNAEVCELSRKIDAMNSTLAFLEDQTKNAKWNDEKEKEQIRLREAFAAIDQRQITVAEQEREIEDLRSQLDRAKIISTDLVDALDNASMNTDCSNDLLEVLSFGREESMETQNRSRWISNTDEFKNWMGQPEARAIFVECHSDFEPITAGSFLVTLLNEHLRIVPRTLVLTFFCGLNSVSPTQETLSGPTLMAKSLFAQLLSVEGLDAGDELVRRRPLSFLGLTDVTRMQEDCFETHMDAITRLILALSHRYSAIFVMIDSVDFYDRNWENEIEQFIDLWKKTIRKVNRRKKKSDVTGVLKVLITASSRAAYFYPPGKFSDVFEMPEENDADDQGSYDEFG